MNLFVSMYVYIFSLSNGVVWRGGKHVPVLPWHREAVIDSVQASCYAVHCNVNASYPHDLRWSSSSSALGVADVQGPAVTAIPVILCL